VVFSPQIIENFRRSSADGLSLEFIVIWLAGDVFNILGAVMQGVLPTMLILAVYYTLADIVLLVQCGWYRGWLRPGARQESDAPDETSPLLGNGAVTGNGHHAHGEHIDVSHLSPATPLTLETSKHPSPPPPPTSMAKTVTLNTFAILLVILSGIAGWYLSNVSSTSQTPPDRTPHPNDELILNVWGQVFGYLCALLYLGSRLPQILLNYRRKSTDGLSGLFFLFACLGNVTYFLSIFAYSPECYDAEGRERECASGEALKVYGQYLLVNASWLLGSIGCLGLDFTILTQFLMYNGQSPKSETASVEGAENGLLAGGQGGLVGLGDEEERRDVLGNGYSGFSSSETRPQPKRMTSEEARNARPLLSRLDSTM
jgi:uncharacterized protein with PQ loop repeat